ncbi:hypothetical protein AAFF_G00177610 [Aldrovandia affinis]|uniref:Uromodulin-like 1 n=1 Tax=Aldrovandia affinis TaxID=143900 RepID=A0AAD7RL05_9TELE|nr:hypothetical protein AAFF_G00177610 [Aldrovandia affinis]
MTFRLLWEVAAVQSFPSVGLVKDSRSLHRQGINLRLDNIELTSIRSERKFASFSVTSFNVLTLNIEYAGIFKVWNFSIVSGSDSISVSSLHSTVNLPTNSTLEALRSFKPHQVFACESNILYLHQNEEFILALGHTMRFPLTAESQSISTLLISWREDTPLPPDQLHVVSLYRLDLDALVPLSNDSTHSSHYRFGTLKPCRRYVACVETAGSPSVVCLTELTDPDVPRNFRVTVWDSSSVTVAWDCPLNNPAPAPTVFQVTVFHLNGSDHILEEASFRHELDDFVFFVGGLPPCSKVKLGLRAVCQFQGQSRYSSMVLSEGNSANSQIINLYQFSSGLDNYTVNWSVQNTSSISTFRVYHQGELQSSTLITSHTVTGLLPCQQYSCRVEAVCGDDTVMSIRTIQTRTGPGMVVELQFQQQDSMALWRSMSGPGVVFLYQLSEGRSGPNIRRGRLTDSTLPLPDLQPGHKYALEVMEECEGGQRGAFALLCFVTDTSNDALLLKKGNSTGQTSDDRRLQFDVPNQDLLLVVPWLMPSSLKDPTAEPRVKLEDIIKNKLQALLREYRQKIEVQLISFEDSESKTRTKITFQTFDVSSQDAVVNLSPKEQLDYINSLNHPHIIVEDDIIYWDDSDECDSPTQNDCGSNSLCINTLDSFTCVCKPGYYDTSPFLGPSCHEKGMFTLCKKGYVAGGISKSFLIQLFGGNVSVILNDGYCTMNETEEFYFYWITGPPTQCGAKKHMNQTHVEFENTMTVTLSSETTITRRDLQVLWKCAYHRLATSIAHVKPDLDWFNSFTLVEFNSSRLLEVSMALYTDASFMYNYTEAVELSSSEYLYIQVTLHSQNTLAYNMTLEVESCWATESSNPQEERKAFFLREGCPIDKTFNWYLPNGSQQKSRFSVQMFTMSVQKMPIYLHCLARICSSDENCTMICPVRKSKNVRRDLGNKMAAIVSAGPVSTRTAKGKPSHWNGPLIVLSVVGGAIGLLVLTALGVHAAKAIAEYPWRHQ